MDCQEKTALCADHCRRLLYPDDDDFQCSCDHEHALDCEYVLTEISEKITSFASSRYSQERKDHLYDFKQAQTNIYQWKAHILRSVNQEEAKQETLQVLDETSVLVIMDWAMKYVQRRCSEK